jgi:hypothetical protein
VGCAKAPGEGGGGGREVEVSADDAAFSAPDKPFGPFYSVDEAEGLRTERGLRLVEDAGSPNRQPQSKASKCGVAATGNAAEDNVEPLFEILPAKQILPEDRGPYSLQRKDVQ